MSSYNPQSVILAPLITEKATNLKDEANQYSFAVTRDATKGEIKQAIATIFKVRPLRVRTLLMLGKERRLGRFQGRRPDWKKAIVTVGEGQKIDFEKL